MTKSFLMLIPIMILTGCTFFSIQHVPVIQGVHIPKQKLQQLKTGMTKTTVKTLLGDPLLTHLFSPNHLEYIYTIQEQNTYKQYFHITCLFQQQKLKYCKQID